MEPYAGSYQQSDQLFKWRGLDETQETQQTHEQRVQAQAQEEHAAPIDERQQTLQKSSDVYNAVKSGSQIGVLYEGVRQPDSQIMATMDKFMNLYPKGLVPDDVRRIPFLKQTLKQILENTIRVIIELIDELTAEAAATGDRALLRRRLREISSSRVQVNRLRHRSAVKKMTTAEPMRSGTAMSRIICRSPFDKTGPFRRCGDGSNARWEALPTSEPSFPACTSARDHAA